MTPVVPLAVAVASACLCGCVHERSRILALVPEGSLARDVEESRSTGVARASGGAYSTSARAPSPPTGAVDVASRVPPPREPATPTSTSASTPTSTAAVGTTPNPARPAAHRPLAAGKTLADVAREKFLTAPTVVDARKATFYCPPAYASEVSLAGAAVTEDGPGRRSAAGHAVLRLRNLTVRAERISVVVRSDGNLDVQLSARGDVTLRSDQAASRIEESGLKSLLLTNDGYTPLR